MPRRPSARTMVPGSRPCESATSRATRMARGSTSEPNVFTAAAGARVREERARAARRVDDDLARLRRERLHDEVDDVTRREELALVTLRDARHERLEDRVEGLEPLVTALEGAREQRVDARDERLVLVRSSRGIATASSGWARASCLMLRRRRPSSCRPPVTAATAKTSSKASSPLVARTISSMCATTLVAVAPGLCRFGMAAKVAEIGETRHRVVTTAADAILRRCAWSLVCRWLPSWFASSSSLPAVEIRRTPHATAPPDVRATRAATAAAAAMHLRRNSSVTGDPTKGILSRERCSARCGPFEGQVLTLPDGTIGCAEAGKACEADPLAAGRCARDRRRRHRARPDRHAQPHPVRHLRRLGLAAVEALPEPRRLDEGHERAALHRHGRREAVPRGRLAGQARRGARRSTTHRQPQVRDGQVGRAEGARRGHDVDRRPRRHRAALLRVARALHRHAVQRPRHATRCRLQPSCRRRPPPTACARTTRAARPPRT